MLICKGKKKKKLGQLAHITAQATLLDMPDLFVVIFIYYWLNNIIKKHFLCDNSKYSYLNV